MESIRSPQELLETIRTLRQEVSSAAAEAVVSWEACSRRASFRDSAENMACYLALRERDLRDLQPSLTRWGLSSLGRSEAHVMATLDALIATLSLLAGCNPEDRPQYPAEEEMKKGTARISMETTTLFGEPSAARQTRILVTLPGEARDDVALFKELLRSGMECVRINCAHDDADTWLCLIRSLRRAELELGSVRRARVLMDLGGPKIRTVLPKKADETRLSVGDELWLTRPDTNLFKAHKREELPVVGCTLREALDRLEIGERVFIDDGKIGAKVLEARPNTARLEVFQAPDRGRKLHPDKGLNFPDTDFDVSPLTDKDRADLPFIAEHADLVGYSFVQTEEDIDTLMKELERVIPASREAPALVLKIETKRAVRNLPSLLVSAASRLPTAVMIARGDLAVELGFRRMAEMQEEILWLCEAARVPVIWATQVLETLTKDGLPTRAEVTDAAMSSRAECVMLNKGPHVVEAVRLLDDVLTRMQGHQYKKSARLRALHAWAKVTESDAVRSRDHVPALPMKP
jgi:pyruvate kinase